MINKPQTYWNNVLFAGESKFNIFGSDGRITVSRRKNEELNPKNLVGTVKAAVCKNVMFEYACKYFILYNLTGNA